MPSVRADWSSGDRRHARKQDSSILSRPFLAISHPGDGRPRHSRLAGGRRSTAPSAWTGRRSTRGDHSPARVVLPIAVSVRQAGPGASHIDPRPGGAGDRPDLLAVARREPGSTCRPTAGVAFVARPEAKRHHRHDVDRRTVDHRTRRSYRSCAFPGSSTDPSAAGKTYTFAKDGQLAIVVPAKKSDGLPS